MYNKIIVRFAPSPTGKIHLGNLRLLLFNLVFAKVNNGDIYLRIDDTDRNRSKTIFEDYAFNIFDKFNISFNKIFRQTERINIYKQYIDILIKNEFAYQKDNAIYFDLSKYPYDKIFFKDEIYGDISILKKDCEDFVICRSDGMPVYIFASIIDDLEMGITHVIRGNDHITNTFKAIVISYAIKGLNYKICYAHIPLIHSQNNTKLSKRENDIDIDFLLSNGYLINALKNYLFRLGWGYKNYEYFDLDNDIYDIFDLKQIKKSSAMFDIKKLNAVNSYHLRKLSDDNLKDTFIKYISEYNLYHNNNYLKKIDKIIYLFKNRSNTLKDIFKQSSFIFNYKDHISSYISDRNTIFNKNEKINFLYDMINKKINSNDFNLAREIITGNPYGINIYDIIDLIEENNLLEYIEYIKNN